VFFAQIPEKKPGYIKYRSGGICLQGIYEKKVKFISFSPKMVSQNPKKRKKDRKQSQNTYY
jgi:hypothetical protein